MHKFTVTSCISYEFFNYYDDFGESLVLKGCPLPLKKHYVPSTLESLSNRKPHSEPSRRLSQFDRLAYPVVNSMGSRIGSWLDVFGKGQVGRDEPGWCTLARDTLALKMQVVKCVRSTCHFRR